MAKKLLLFLLILLNMTLSAKDHLFHYNDTSYISYSITGNGNTHMVFLHGYGASRVSWEEIAHRIDTNKYKLFLLDLKGFGKSSIPKDGHYSIADQATIVQSFVQRHVDSNFILVGHSYGGGVALYLCAMKLIHPAKLIFLDGAAYDWDNPFFIVGMKLPLINHASFWFTTARFRARFILKRIVHKDNYGHHLTERYEPVLKGKEKAYSYIQVARQIIPENYDTLISSYAQIEIPTLIIWGKEDKVLSLRQGEELHKQLLHSELHVLPKCGHVPHEELPDQTFNLIKAFLEK